jgi:hypothetical protein
MGVLYTHSPKSLGPFPKLLEKNSKKIQKIQKNGTICLCLAVNLRPMGDRWSPADLGAMTWGRRLAVAHRPRVDTLIGTDCPFFLNFFFLTLHFLRKWSTLVGWLQHMPALARPCPKTSTLITFDP